VSNYKEVQPEFVKENIGQVANSAVAILRAIKQRIDKVVTGGGSAIQKDVVAKFKANSFIRIYIDDLDRG